MIARELLEGIAGYSGLFFFCAGSGIFLPVPEDIALMYAGMRVEEGHAALLPTWLVAVGGVLSRDAMAYGIGRLFGDWVLENAVVKKVIGKKRLARARAAVDDHGVRSVLVGRFVVGFRAPVFMACGAARVPFTRFMGWDLAGLMIAVPAALGLGYVFGAPLIDATFWFLGHLRTTGLVVAVLLVGALFAWMRWNRETS